MQELKLFVISVLMVPLMAQAIEEDDWIGLQQARYSLDINYGVDSENESVWGLGLGLPAPAYSELYVAYSKYEVADGDVNQQLQDYSVAWISDPYAAWSLELEHSYQGKSGAVEVTQNVLGVYHSPHNWRVGLHLFDGQVKGYRRETIVERFNVSDSASIDRKGYGFSLAQLNNTWLWGLDAKQFDYSRDLSNVLNSRLFLLNFNSAVVSHVLLLTNWNVGLQLQKQFDSVSLNGGVEHYEEVVGRSEDTRFSAGLDFAVSAEVNLALDYFYFSQDANNFINVSLAFNW